MPDTETERHHLLLHHDQHESVRAACSAPRPFKHQKQNVGRKERCRWTDVSPAARSARHAVGHPPVSPQDAVHVSGGCRRRTQADGKEGPPPEKHTHMHTHSHTLSVCIFSHNGQQHGDVIWLPSCKIGKNEREEFIHLKATRQIIKRLKHGNSTDRIHTSYIQTIVTSKLCKRRHIVGVVCKVVRLFGDALCSLQDAVIVGRLK